jgi:hypothetical protein
MAFLGRYFHVEDAILELKPVQKPRPPVMIAGGGEQMTLRAVARLVDAGYIVGGDPATVSHKLAVLRGHCDAAVAITTRSKRPISRLGFLARNDAALAAKRERRGARGSLRGYVGTVSEAIDLIGIPSSRHRATDQWRSERRRHPRTLRLGCHATRCLTEGLSGPGRAGEEYSNVRAVWIRTASARKGAGVERGASPEAMPAASAPPPCTRSRRRWRCCT